MRRALVLAVAALAWAPAAHAAPPTVSAQVSAASGAAPLHVTLTASGDAASYHWTFGDGQSADGQTVDHTYGAGLFTATVTAASATGETATAQTRVVSIGLALAKPKHFVDYGKRLTFHGTLAPRVGSVLIYRGTTLVARGRAKKNGVWHATAHIRAPGDYVARIAGVTSAAVPVRVRPRVDVRLEGSTIVGGKLAVVARARPSAAAFRIRIFRSGVAFVDRTVNGATRIPLATRHPIDYVVRVSTAPAPGFVASTRRLHAVVVEPNLSVGSSGASVRMLEQRLWDLHYALERVDGSFGQDTYDAVVAFQKVNGLSRSGRVDSAVWRRLESASIPRARFGGGNHVEVDKTRQVLFEVRGGEVALTVPVSTGATGNTPVGTWHVYRRVVGFDWVLYYPAYFLRGFAIHGYPDVPTYPASHGCVRVPMWVASRLYELHPYGYTVRIYY